MIYNSANAVLKGIKANWANAFNDFKDSNFLTFADTVISNSNEEKYYIPESVGKIMRIDDQIKYQRFSDFALTLTNKEFGGGILVDRSVLKDSNEYMPGTILRQVQQWMQAWKGLPGTELQALLEANGTAFDGTAFFATTRPNLDTGGNTIDNLHTGTGVTFATFEADYAAAKTKILGYKDKNNMPFNENAQLAVFVPQHLADLANQLLSERADRVYDGTAEKSNIYRGTAQIVINYNQGSSDNDWYIINTSSVWKPFIVQSREMPQWYVKDDEEFKEIKYFTKGRLCYALGNPLSIIKINN